MATEVGAGHRGVARADPERDIPRLGRGSRSPGVRQLQPRPARHAVGSTHLRRVALGRRRPAPCHGEAIRPERADRRAAGKGATVSARCSPRGRARGRGHARSLLRRLLDGAAAEGFGLSLLFSEIDPRYYDRLGFRRLPLNQLALAVRPLPARGQRRRFPSAPGISATWPHWSR